MDRNVYEACRVVSYYRHPTQDSPSTRFWNQGMSSSDTLSWEQWHAIQENKGLQALYFVTESSANGREALSLPNVTPAMVVCCYADNTSAFWTLREGEKGINVLEEHQWSLPADSFSFPFHSNSFLSVLNQARDLSKQLEFPYYENLFQQAKECLLTAPSTNLFHLDPSHASLFHSVETANVFYPGSAWMTEIKDKAYQDESTQKQYDSVSDTLLAQLRQALMASINDSPLDFSVESEPQKEEKPKKKYHWFSRKGKKAKGQSSVPSHLSSISPHSVPEPQSSSISSAPSDFNNREKTKDAPETSSASSAEQSVSTKSSSIPSEPISVSQYPSPSSSLSLTPCPDTMLQQYQQVQEQKESKAESKPIRNPQIPSKKAQSDSVLSHPQESSSPRLSEQASEEVKRILEENHARQSKKRLASQEAESTDSETIEQKISKESEWLEEDELPDQFDSFYLHPEEWEPDRDKPESFSSSPDWGQDKLTEQPIQSTSPEVPLRVKEPQPKRITSWVGVIGFWLGVLSLLATVVVRFLPLDINLVLTTVMETVTALCFAVFSVDLYLSRRIHQKWIFVLALLLSILCIGTTLIQGTAIVQDFRQNAKTAILDTYSLNYHPENSEQKSYVLNGLTKDEKHYQLRINGRQAKRIYGAQRLKVQFYPNMKIALSCQKLK